MMNENLITKNSNFREISWIALLVSILFITSCSKHGDDAAQILGLEMGGSKSEVMDNLLKNSFVTHVRPDVAKIIEVKKNK